MRVLVGGGRGAGSSKLLKNGGEASIKNNQKSVKHAIPTPLMSLIPATQRNGTGTLHSCRQPRPPASTLRRVQCSIGRRIKLATCRLKATFGTVALHSNFDNIPNEPHQALRPQSLHCCSLLWLLRCQARSPSGCTSGFLSFPTLHNEIHHCLMKCLFVFVRSKSPSLPSMPVCPAEAALVER